MGVSQRHFINYSINFDVSSQAPCSLLCHHKNEMLSYRVCCDVCMHHIFFAL